MTNTTAKPVATGQHLVNKGLLTEEQLHIALEQQKRAAATGRSLYLGEILVRNNFVTRYDMIRTIAEFKTVNGGPFSNIGITTRLRKRLGVLVLGVEDDALKVACTRPLGDDEIRELIQAANLGGVQVSRVVTELRDRMEVLLELGRHSFVDQNSMQTDIAALNSEPTNGQLLQQVIRNILIDAIQSRASDIHIDHMQDMLDCWVSYRVDGVMRPRYLLSQQAMAALATRIKGDAGMDFSENRRPQDGRMETEYDSRVIDLRVAAIPVDNGEAITIRLLDQSQLRTLDMLLEHHQPILNRMKAAVDIRTKTGALMLVTGPTGHGKSTTLYAMLRDMPRHQINIMTAEDPVEYRMPGVRQTAINRLTGLTYSAILVAQLRQDPDVLVIGEMRDSETVEAGLRSVESGHTVLSTVHTNDVVQAIIRLCGMTPEDYRESGQFVIANYLRLVMNQRLGRRLCACAQPVRADAAGRRYQPLLKRLGIDPATLLKKPVGCEQCEGSGYFGRVLAPEFLYLPGDRELRTAFERLLRNPGEGSIRMLLEQPGVEYYRRETGICELLKAGLIDLDTAANILNADDLEIGTAAATEQQLAAGVQPS